LPDRRLVLHVAAADLASARPPEVDDPAVAVVLVVPSLLQLLQAGWADALGARRWSTFEAWLDTALGGGQHEGPGWRYDEVVAGWVDAVGADRVQVVLGDAAGTAAGAVGRALSWAEVGMVDALVVELEALELVGRNAAEMVWSGIDHLRRAETDAPLGSSPLPLALEDRLVATARSMAARLDATGVRVTGDRSALDWPDGSTDAGGAVGLAEATRLAMGALERVATWGREETA
jgi:hypothetical protein